MITLDASWVATGLKLDHMLRDSIIEMFPSYLNGIHIGHSR